MTQNKILSIHKSLGRYSLCIVLRLYKFCKENICFEVGVFFPKRMLSQLRRRQPDNCFKKSAELNESSFLDLITNELTKFAGLQVSDKKCFVNVVWVRVLGCFFKDGSIWKRYFVWKKKLSQRQEKMERVWNWTFGKHRDIDSAEKM